MNQQDFNEKLASLGYSEEFVDHSVCWTAIFKKDNEDSPRYVTIQYFSYEQDQPGMSLDDDDWSDNCRCWAAYFGEIPEDAEWNWTLYDSMYHLYDAVIAYLETL